MTKRFPEEGKYGLSLQLRGSGVSIPSNIAEGYGRKGRQEYIYYLYVAYGSYCELETQLMIAVDLGYVDGKQKGRMLGLGKEVERMLKVLIASLQKKLPSNP